MRVRVKTDEWLADPTDGYVVGMDTYIHTSIQANITDWAKRSWSNWESERIEPKAVTFMESLMISRQSVYISSYPLLAYGNLQVQAYQLLGVAFPSLQFFEYILSMTY